MMNRFDNWYYRLLAWIQLKAAKKQQVLLDKYPPPEREIPLFISDVDVQRVTRYRRSRRPIEEWT